MVNLNTRNFNKHLIDYHDILCFRSLIYYDNYQQTFVAASFVRSRDFAIEELVSSLRYCFMGDDDTRRHYASFEAAAPSFLSSCFALEIVFISQSVPGNTTSRISRVLKRSRGLQKTVAVENRYGKCHGLVS